MQDGRRLDVSQGSIDDFDGVCARRFDPRLEIRLVDLHYVGAGGDEVVDLVIDGDGEIHRQARLVAVEVVDRLLGHGERPGHGDLDRPIGLRTQELDVADLDRVLATNRTDDPRHDIRPAASAQALAGIVEIDALQGRGEAVAVAFAADLAVGDDVDAGALHVADGYQGGRVLGVFEPRLGYAPHVRGADPRRQPLAELVAVQEPVGLRVAADDGGGKQGNHLPLPLGEGWGEGCVIAETFMLVRTPHPRYRAASPKGRGELSRRASISSHSARPWRAQAISARARPIRPWSAWILSWMMLSCSSTGCRASQTSTSSARRSRIASSRACHCSSRHWNWAMWARSCSRTASSGARSKKAALRWTGSRCAGSGMKSVAQPRSSAMPSSVTE